MSAPNVLLMGAPGGGKTHSIRTLIDCGITPFILFTESGTDILQDIPAEKCHWAKVSPTSGGWDAMTKKVENSTKMSWDQIQKMADPNKKEYHSYTDLLYKCQDFVCDRTGESFGDVTKFGEDKALVLDSLSGLNDMVLQVVKGGSIGCSQPQWGGAMGMEMELITKLCNDTECYFIMTSHLDRIIDEVMGGQVILPLGLGKKNGPQIPRHFSDVILCEKRGDKWVWATEHAHAELKARNLPYNKELRPDFKQIVDTFNKRKEMGNA